MIESKTELFLKHQSSRFDRQEASSLSIPVMLAVNTDAGMFSGRVVGIEIGDALHLEGPIEVSRCGFDLDASGDAIERFPDWPPRGVKMFGRRFPISGYTTHVGNIIWDCAWMSGSCAITLLNLIKNTPGWGCSEGESRMFQIFNHQGSVFTLRDARILAKREW